MKKKTIFFAALVTVVSFALAVPAAEVQAQTQAAQRANKRIEKLQVSEQAGKVYVRVSLNGAITTPPQSFTVANPARIAFDFPATENGLGRTQQEIRQGGLHSANIVQVGNRTRLVLNLTQLTQFETSIEGQDLIIGLSSIGSGKDTSQATEVVASYGSNAQLSSASMLKSVLDIDFRRGKDGEGRVVVQLGRADTEFDIRRQGSKLIVDFLDTMLPASLQRKSDVGDFGTPIASFEAQNKGGSARVVVSPSGVWEYNAYQSETQFILEVRRVLEDPNSLVQGSGAGYKGEKLSLNFQDVDVRSVLQVIADFTDFNIVTSDSVQGNLTLRLQDVPWDQALDIILQAKGLDKRKTGNVIWIAPADELEHRERRQLEAKAQVADLEPLRTESFQINYHKASEIQEFLTKDKNETVLSKRGSVVYDDRSNKIFITDVGERLEAFRRLIAEIDLAPRQVLIEARIVEASKSFARDLGIRLGVGGVGGRVVGYDSGGRPIRQGSVGGGLDYTSSVAGNVVNSGSGLPRGLNLDLAAAPASGTAGALSMVLWNNAATRFLNLELSALENDGRGRIISSPRVLTANQVEAVIEQGTEIPYQEASSSGATTTSFKKAVMSLKVKPQITPDGRIFLSVQVNKDRADYANVSAGAAPAIETKNVGTEVMVTNGGTVVIGGIYEEETKNTVSQIPLLGDIPYVGALFRNKSTMTGTREMLVFITPRIVSDNLNLR